MDFIVPECRGAEKNLLEMRRILHTIPEIGGSLPKTREFVCTRLKKVNIPYHLNNGDDGIVAEIQGAYPGKTVAFRADMDGLHIEEETEVPFRSKIKGQMHGCGHDVHTAVLLTAAEILQKHRDILHGTVRLLFQTGEETGTGAKQMLAEGALEGVDAIFALHAGNLAGNDLPAGNIVILPGPVSAGKNKFTITVNGKGTHSAFPEKGVDPILIAARIVNGCEEIMARELPAGTAAVLSFGSLQAGLDHNTIPETAVIKGSIRCQDAEIREFIGKRLKSLSEGICQAFRASCQVELKQGSSTVMNDRELAAFAAETVGGVLGKDTVTTQLSAALMGSDDFANYAMRIPAVYFMLHTNNTEKGITEANHSPRFDVDETVMWKGAAACVALAIEYLKG